MTREPADSDSPRKVTGLRGTVSAGVYGKGSKSERQAVFFKCANGRYLLRWKTGPVYGDTSLNEFIGQDVVCDGFVVGTTLLAERIAPEG